MPHSLTDKQALKIAVLGAAGGIGQSFSMLLKTQLHTLLLPHSDKHLHVAMYDINKDAIVGTVADLSHIDTPVTLSHHFPASRDDLSALKECLADAALIVIPAGVPRKPGMTRDDLFAINAKILLQLSDGIASFCDLSKIFVLVISNPVNSLVPVMIKRLSQHASSKGSLIERRVFGLTQLDMVRASTFIQQLTGFASNATPYIPVVGGHSGDTIIPMFSQVMFKDERLPLDMEQRKSLIHRVQYGGDEIVKAKNGAGSATLSMAYAAFKITRKFVDLLLGNATSLQDTLYISLKDASGNYIAPGAQELMALINVSYFSIPVTVSTKGVTHVDSEILNKMDEYERNTLLPVCLKNLQGNIETGLDFVN